MRLRIVLKSSAARGRDIKPSEPRTAGLRIASRPRSAAMRTALSDVGGVGIYDHVQFPLTINEELRKARLRRAIASFPQIGSRPKSCSASRAS